MANRFVVFSECYVGTFCFNLHRCLIIFSFRCLSTRVSYFKLKKKVVLNIFANLMS